MVAELCHLTIERIPYISVGHILASYLIALPIDPALFVFHPKNLFTLTDETYSTKGIPYLS